MEGNVHIQLCKQVFVLKGDDCTLEQDFMAMHGQLRGLQGIPFMVWREHCFDFLPNQTANFV